MGYFVSKLQKLFVLSWDNDSCIHLPMLMNFAFLQLEEDNIDMFQ
jgi:hypothetical protein